MRGSTGTVSLTIRAFHDRVAGTAIDPHTRCKTWIRAKLHQWFDNGTTRTDLIGIRIASGLLNPHPTMKQHVILVILTNHEWRIIGHAAISMMNDRLRR